MIRRFKCLCDECKMYSWEINAYLLEMPPLISQSDTSFNSLFTTLVYIYQHGGQRFRKFRKRPTIKKCQLANWSVVSTSPFNFCLFFLLPLEPSNGRPCRRLYPHRRLDLNCVRSSGRVGLFLAESRRERTLPVRCAILRVSVAVRLIVPQSVLGICGTHLKIWKIICQNGKICKQKR